MASAPPPDKPPAKAHATAFPDGNGEWLASAIPVISNKPLRCAIAVSTNAFARRAPYPPTKSLVPHAKTAVRLKLVGTVSDGSVIGVYIFGVNETSTRRGTRCPFGIDASS